MSDTIPDTQRTLINEQYLTLQLIGRGGFGVVWKAYDFSLRNFVAVKELLKDYNQSKYIEMFYKEALISKNIIHDNIVRVQHFWKATNGSHFIMMDYVGGSDLEKLVRKCSAAEKPVPWELCVLITSSILKALDYANRQAKDPITGAPYGIVYRDISPGNIIISFEGGIKLSDFGIAKTAEELNGGLKQRVVTGKYAYMSPEQIRGLADIDHRSDIFSVGLVLYEMLAGGPLYKGQPEEIKEQVISEKFNPAALSARRIPEGLLDVLGKALAKDREKRYQKAIEMFRDLRRLLRGRETEELTEDLATFMRVSLPEEVGRENESTNWVKQLTLQDAKNDGSILKLLCRDFIVGEKNDIEPGSDTTEPVAEERQEQEISGGIPAAAEQLAQVTHPEQETLQPAMPAGTEPEAANETAPPQADEPAVPAAPEIMTPPFQKAHGALDLRGPAEDKGKTVFEEVGDWLVNKFRVYRTRVIRGAVALAVFAIVFFVLDVYTQLTPMGKNIYSRLYPPDVVITTVPGGALVSMKTRDGKMILNNVDSINPIPLRKIPAGTYVITATKESFKTLERVVRVEDQPKGSQKQQQITLSFDFAMSINSNPPGAEIYVDGNKFRTTPWKGELTSGEHTIRLTLDGFEELGSLAKEARDGQCNIDFTRSSIPEMFSGVDTKYWTYEIINSNNESVFALVGSLFKKITINSVPQGMLVHLDNESQERGKTPLVATLKCGEYRVRYMDPEGKYEETSHAFSVDAKGDTEVIARLKRFVVFKVRSRENHEEAFLTSLRISGQGLSITREISPSRPVRLALPVGAYRVTFTGGNGFKPMTYSNVDIADKSLFFGDLEYEEPRLKVAVREEKSEQPIPEAFIWYQNKVIGRSNQDGEWEGEVKRGPGTVRIVAKGYLEKTFERKLPPGKHDEITAVLSPDVPVSTQTAVNAGAGASNDSPGPSFWEMKKPSPDAVKPIIKEPSVPATQQQGQTIVCPFCKKEYILPPGKRLRFCTNCGKSFR